MLIVFSGLPGVGKSTLAKALAKKTSAIYLRIDSVEQAIRSAKVLRDDIGISGYAACYALAKDNLLLGQTVIADCVNPVSWSRDAWMRVATEAEVPGLEVEIVCSDLVEHRQRVETRKVDVPELTLPDWAAIMSKEYQPWQRARIVIDTAGKEIACCVDELLAHIHVCE
ncbi:AAA family ATPase [Pragia fontium]|uniref:Predicted kinase n=2 Tax=Pragia fontium TaxID=82985 RepID=A0AAJ4W7S1_9GAMM|nr:AAA family ATPase [Pragia fontium]GKX62907.1 kinase [Pragia fontium]SFC03041.1 Predicted kinase [Pragia fontium DSM 5563 = ATCC 49100]VEJ54037.1 Uncharacterised protein [Pragia fontium]